MIVDASAIVAILRNETEAVRCADLLLRAEHPRLSAASYLEAAIVFDGKRKADHQPAMRDLSAGIILRMIRVRHTPASPSQPSSIASL